MNKTIKKLALLTGVLILGAITVFSVQKVRANERSPQQEVGVATTSSTLVATFDSKCGEGKCGEGKCGTAASKKTSKKAGKTKNEKASKKSSKKSTKKAKSSKKSSESKCGAGKCGGSN